MISQFSITLEKFQIFVSNERFLIKKRAGPKPVLPNLKAAWDAAHLLFELLVEVGEIESPSEIRKGKTLQAYPIYFLAEVYEIGKISPRSHYLYNAVPLMRAEMQGFSLFTPCPISENHGQDVA